MYIVRSLDATKLYEKFNITSTCGSEPDEYYMIAVLDIKTKTVKFMQHKRQNIGRKDGLRVLG